MIDLFIDLSPDTRIDDAVQKASRESRQGNWRAAAKYLSAALLSPHSREEQYSTAVAAIADAFERIDQPRAALTASWYAGGDLRRQERLLDAVPPVDRARTYAYWAARDPSRAREYHRAAAQELDQAGLLVRAAVHYERADDESAARTLWSRLSQMIDKRRDAYAAGLARFNVARMCGKDERAAFDATVSAVHHLEEAADRFEASGLRERAFDCYHVLIAIGELGGQFEHVLEGAVNAIRILSEDNLRYHALRLQSHAIALAEDNEELSAAAGLAREMTDYARKQGLPRVAASGVLKQAGLWQRVADKTQERQGPPQLVENALIASLLANAEAGRYARVGQLYAELAELVTEPGRREHYARAAKRYEGERDDARRGEEERLGDHVGPPDVWHVDLLEWEGRGSAVEACGDVLLDPEESGDRITRRSALVGRLVALAAEQAPSTQSTRATVLLAEHLAPIGLYGLLSPLETMFESPEREVRLAAVRALSRYYYKRTFVTLERALRDPDSTVAEEATVALERLRFDHAFEPLSRIYRTTTRRPARLAALRAIARIDVVDAAELLLGVLEHGGPDEREAALSSLKVTRSTRFFDLARSTLPQASGHLKEALTEVMQARGLST